MRRISGLSLITFLLSVIIGGLPSIGLYDLFQRWFKSAELAVFVFWWGGLFVLAGCTMALSRMAKLTIFLTIIIGFFLAAAFGAILSLREFPVPIEIYVRSFISMIMQSSTAAAVGLLVGSVFRRRLRETS